MPLPKTITPPKNDLGAKIILLYGIPKIGKSTIISQFPDVVFMATEPGLNNLATFKDDITSWTQFTDNCNELGKEAKSSKPRFKTIAIDTVDLLFKMCSEFKCKEKNVSHESDLPYGKGFSMVNNEFQRVLIKLSQLPYGLVMISHATEKEVDTRLGKVKKTMPTLPGAARLICMSLADIILYGDIENVKDENGKTTSQKRVLRTKPTIFYEAGDRTGKLSDTIDFNYDALVADFNKGI